MHQLPNYQFKYLGISVVTIYFVSSLKQPDYSHHYNITNTSYTIRPQQYANVFCCVQSW